MFAMTVLPSYLPLSPTLAALLAIPVLLPLAVLIAAGRSRHWRRVIAGACLALILASTMHASDGEFVILDNCQGLNADDALYWIYGCILRPYWPF